MNKNDEECCYCALRPSRYDRYFRNHVEDESPPLVDLALVVREDSLSNEKEARRLMVHSGFFIECELIKLALSQPMRERRSKEVTLVVPEGTSTRAFDALVQYCYDGFLRQTRTVVLNVFDIWRLAHYLQCNVLMSALVDKYTLGKLLSPLSCAQIIKSHLDNNECISEMYAMTIQVLVESCSKADDDDEKYIERILDINAPLVFSALIDLIIAAKDDDETQEKCIKVIGEYLAEVPRKERARLNVQSFAHTVFNLLPGTVKEQTFAALILDYLEDNGSATTEAASVLLSLVSWSFIPPSLIQYKFAKQLRSFAPILALQLLDSGNQNCTKSTSSIDQVHDYIEIPLRCMATGKLLYHYRDEIIDMATSGNPPPILSLYNQTAAVIIEDYSFYDILCGGARKQKLLKDYIHKGIKPNDISNIFGKKKIHRGSFRSALASSKHDDTFKMIEDLRRYYENKSSRLEAARNYFCKDIPAESFEQKIEDKARPVKRPRLLFKDNEDDYALFQGNFDELNTTQVVHIITSREQKVADSCQKVHSGLAMKALSRGLCFYYGEECICTMSNGSRQVRSDATWNELNFKSGEVINIVLEQYGG